VSRLCPVEILGTRASASKFNFNAFCWADGVCFRTSTWSLAVAFLVPTRKAADLTPQLAASPSDHEQGNT
jgi:hypothetical protein